RTARRPARARNQAGHSKSLQQEATVQLQQAYLQAALAHRERVQQVEGLQAHRNPLRQAGAKLPGLCLPRRCSCMVDLMSLDPRLGGMGSAGIIEAMTYFGTYAVNERNHKLTLHVQYCLFRSCDHADRTAELKILGDTMEFISTVDTSPTGASYSRTVWKRACCK